MENERSMDMRQSLRVEHQSLPDEEIKRRFAYAVRAAMKYRGLKMAGLSRIIGNNENTIGRWMNGTTAPCLVDIGKLANALGFDPELFIYPPAIPDYPLAEHLLENQGQSTQS